MTDEIVDLISRMHIVQKIACSKCDKYTCIHLPNYKAALSTRILDTLKGWKTKWTCTHIVTHTDDVYSGKETEDGVPSCA